MARKALCRAAGSVRYARQLSWLQAADLATEDPSEFFTMIFGGEAFVDWYDLFPHAYNAHRNEESKC
jgi:hypothetical protein